MVKGEVCILIRLLVIFPDVLFCWFSGSNCSSTCNKYCNNDQPYKSVACQCDCAYNMYGTTCNCR